MIKVLIVEPFFIGSHKNWALNLQEQSNCDVKILSLPGRHWKWRMHGGAVTLARKFAELNFIPDVFLCTDMLDVATFSALIGPKYASIPTIAYFHENQLAYPWSKTDQDAVNGRDLNYAFINYTSALRSDKVIFNSIYNQNSFLKRLDEMLARYPDFKEKQNVTKIGEKSDVIAPGYNAQDLNKFKNARENEQPLVLWNHRWEYDKNPETFFSIIKQLKLEGLIFSLAVCGERNERYPEVFDTYYEALKDIIVHFGYFEKREDYIDMLWRADILPVTSIQEFFGISVVEAMHCNCYPLLPNRLSYPEHIPNIYRDKYLYNDTTELLSKIRDQILNFHQSNIDEVQSFVTKYSWANIVEEYDNLFLELLKDKNYNE